MPFIRHASSCLMKGICPKRHSVWICRNKSWGHILIFIPALSHSAANDLTRPTEQHRLRMTEIRTLPIPLQHLVANASPGGNQNPLKTSLTCCQKWEQSSCCCCTVKAKDPKNIPKYRPLDAAKDMNRAYHRTERVTAWDCECPGRVCTRTWKNPNLKPGTELCKIQRSLNTSQGRNLRTTEAKVCLHYRFSPEQNLLGISIFPSGPTFEMTCSSVAQQPLLLFSQRHPAATAAALKTVVNGQGPKAPQIFSSCLDWLISNLHIAWDCRLTLPQT